MNDLSDIIIDQLKLSKKAQLTLLSGDGSDRKFFRIKDHNKSFVCMALPDHEREQLSADQHDWLNVHSTLLGQHIKVPKIFKVIASYGLLIIEDCGDDMLFSIVNNLLKENKKNAVIKLYEQCFAIIAHFLKIKPKDSAHWSQRSFDSKKLKEELDFFNQHFLTPNKNLRLTPGEQKEFDKDVLNLVKYLETFSCYFNHRDFHSRNIMVRDNELIVIDFQDARKGSTAYDLVSLCYDSYVLIDLTMRKHLMELALEFLRKDISNSPTQEISQIWPAVLLQRQLKALGSFGYLTAVKKRGDYLCNVKPALETLQQSEIIDKRWPFLSKTLIEKMSYA